MQQAYSIKLNEFKPPPPQQKKNTTIPKATNISTLKTNFLIKE